MASLKKLAGQTAWYGVSSIFARFLNYLLTPYLTGVFTTEMYGELSIVYAATPFMSALFIHGMEITYFRYANSDVGQQRVFNTGSLSLITSTLLLTSILVIANVPIAHALKIGSHPEFITWIAMVIALDTLCVLPFAKLRFERRPKKYALIRLAGIVLNILLVVFFYSGLPVIAEHDPRSFIAKWYDPGMGIGYYIIANLLSSGFMFLVLVKEYLNIRLQWDTKLWKEMLWYALPLMIAGFAGVINETFDRIMLGWLATDYNGFNAKEQAGVYGANYKLSIIVNLFVQAFRLGAEPFFFEQAKDKDAPGTYARVMKYFVIVLCTMFLVVAMYLDLWKYFIQNEAMWVGLKVVPVLLIAAMCLGVYYNLSIWFKVTKKTKAGAVITIIGAIVTLGVNWLFIPRFGYMACAWATLACYGSMMIISYFWGQRVYPVPYPVVKIARYFLLMLLLFFVHNLVCQYTTELWPRLGVAILFTWIYVVYIIRSEKEDIRKLPFIGRLLK